MLKLGEKGAIPQRDNETFAIAPHIPCGFVTPKLLRRIADTAEKYNAKAIKITGAARIAIVGLKEEDIDGAWEALRLGKGAHDAHPPASRGDLDGLGERVRRSADGLIDHVGASSIGQRTHSLARILLGDVYGIVAAHLPGHLERGLAPANDDNAPGPSALGHLRCRQANGARADNGDRARQNGAV